MQATREHNLKDDPFGNAPLQAGAISTSSRLKALWLRLARGYKIESTHNTPNQNFFGEVYFKTVWILTKKKK